MKVGKKTVNINLGDNVLKLFHIHPQVLIQV